MSIGKLIFSYGKVNMSRRKVLEIHYASRRFCAPGGDVQRQIMSISDLLSGGPEMKESINSSRVAGVREGKHVEHAHYDSADNT